ILSAAEQAAKQGNPFFDRALLRHEWLCGFLWSADTGRGLVRRGLSVSLSTEQLTELRILCLEPRALVPHFFELALQAVEFFVRRWSAHGARFRRGF
ncbi:MAG: hypothetical protein AAB393_12255, partial [Bacteroidota bacterium]